MKDKFRWHVCAVRKLNNPDFKPIEFDGFKKQAGLNSFILTAKQWIEKTDALSHKRVTVNTLQID